MGLFDGLLGGGGDSDLYGDLGDILTPSQRNAIQARGLLAMAGAFGDAAMPSRMPIPIGAVLGKAAGALGAGQDTAMNEAIKNALTIQEIKAARLKMQQQADFLNKGGLSDLIKQLYGPGGPFAPPPAGGGGAGAGRPGVPAAAGAAGETDLTLPALPYPNAPADASIRGSGLLANGNLADPFDMGPPDAGASASPFANGAPPASEAGAAPAAKGPRPTATPPLRANRDGTWTNLKTGKTGTLDEVSPLPAATESSGSSSGGAEPDASAGGDDATPSPISAAAPTAAPARAGLLSPSINWDNPFGTTGGVAATPGGAGSGRYTYEQMKELARQAGFAEKDIPMASAIGVIESGGNPLAHNINGEDSYGLPQINANAWGPQAREALVPQRAFELAKMVKDKQGWGAWRNSIPAALQILAQNGEAPPPDLVGSGGGSGGGGGSGSLPVMQAQYAPGAGGGGMPGMPGVAGVPLPPGLDPTRFQALMFELADRSAKAEILGLGNPYGPALQILQNSPQYQAAAEYLKRSAVLPLLQEEKRQEALGGFDTTAALKAYQATLDRTTEQLRRAGENASAIVDIDVTDPLTNQTVTRKGTKAQQILIANGYSVPELGVRGIYGQAPQALLAAIGIPSVASNGAGATGTPSINPLPAAPSGGAAALGGAGAGNLPFVPAAIPKPDPGVVENKNKTFEAILGDARKQLATYVTQGQNAATQAGLAQQVNDLMPRVKMGFGADAKQTMASFLSSLGVDQKTIDDFKLTDPSAGDALTQTFLRMSLNALHDTGTGAGGRSQSVIGLLKSSQNRLGTEYEAAQLMNNALLMHSRYLQDKATAATEYQGQQLANKGPLGENYHGLDGFEQQFAKTNDPNFYWRAAAAMSGRPDIAWQNLSPADKEKVMSLVPPGAKITYESGLPGPVTPVPYPGEVSGKYRFKAPSHAGPITREDRFDPMNWELNR